MDISGLQFGGTVALQPTSVNHFRLALGMKRVSGNEGDRFDVFAVRETFEYLSHLACETGLEARLLGIWLVKPCPLGQVNNAVQAAQPYHLRRHPQVG